MAETETNTPARDKNDIAWPFEFLLSETVQAHSEDIRVLVLRRPTGQDVLDFGLLDGLVSEKFFPLVARLASVPESTLKKIPADDLLSLATDLYGFFTWAARSRR